MSSTVGQEQIDQLKLRQIIADIDQRRVDIELKRTQPPLESNRYQPQLVATIAAAFAAGGGLVGAITALLGRH